MLSLISSVFLLLVSGIAAAPAEFPNNVLARLEGRKACNADLCLGMMTNRPASALAYCTSLISQTPGTITVTSWVSSTATPAPSSTTLVIGTTTTTTAYSTSTFSSVQTVLYKRTQNVNTALPITSLVPLSCTSSQNAPVSARASSACSCLLSTSATVTVTSTSVSTLPAVTVTSTSSYASTSTTTFETTTTTISTISEPTPLCNLIRDPSFEAIPNVSGGSRTSDYWNFHSSSEGVPVYGSITPLTGQIMLLMQMSYNSASSISQTVSGLSTTSTYTLTYNYWMFSWDGRPACTMTTTANGVNIGSPYTFNSATGGISDSYTAGTPWPSQSFTFTPNAETVSIEATLTCTLPFYSEINLLFDDFSLEMNNNPNVCKQN